MKRLESSGFDRRQAEAIASEIDSGTKEFVTRDILKTELDAAISKVTIKLGALTAAIIGIATTFLGILISIK